MSQGFRLTVAGFVRALQSRAKTGIEGDGLWVWMLGASGPLSGIINYFVTVLVDGKEVVDVTVPGMGP